jgi:hypothetical protein
MTHSQPARTTTRRIRIRRIRVAGLLAVIAAIAAALGYQLPASSSSTPASPIDVLRSEHRGPLGEANGAVPEGTTVFDDDIPGVANLDSDLLGALRQAATDAADDGVEFFVDSGWRSPEYQERLRQIYRNEPWHYELRPEAIDHACQRMYADPTHDPRMQQFSALGVEPGQRRIARSHVFSGRTRSSD